MGRVYERVGVMFFSLVFVMLGNQQNIPRIFQDRLLFYREKGAGVYGPVEYWWSIVVAQVRGWLSRRPLVVSRRVCANIWSMRSGLSRRNTVFLLSAARALILAIPPRLSLRMLLL